MEMEHHEQKEHHLFYKFKVKKFKNLMTILVAVLLILAIFNLIQSTILANKVNEKIKVIEEEKKPANIEMVSIVNSKCSSCFDISSAVESIKQKNVKIKNEKEIEFNSNEAKQLIVQYGIERIPTVIVTGEINKIDLGLNNKNDEALLLKEVPPPYTDAITGEIKGEVKLIYLKADCEDCADLNSVVQALKDSIKVVEEKIYEFGSKEEDELIKKYNIEKLPLFILSHDIEVYEEINAQLESTGTKESDGYYVFREAFAPYYNLKEKKVKGLVSLTYLVDKECSDCYNVKNHKQILDRFGIKLSEEKEIDISSAEGKRLIKDYKITKTPTIILSKDVEAYTSFNGVWNPVGTIETDGSYIFRSVEVMGKYKNLITNEIISPES